MADAELAIRVTGDVAEANEALDSVRDSAGMLDDVDGSNALSGVEDLTESIGLSADELLGWVNTAEEVLEFLGMLRDAINEVAEEFNDLADGALRAGAGVQEFASLRDAFAAVGAGDPGAIISQLNRSLVEAQQPTSRAAQAYAELGLSIDELSRQGATQRINTIAAALQSVGDETDRARLGTAVLGTAYSDLAVAIERSDGNLNALISNYDQYNDLTNDAAEVALELRMANVELATAWDELMSVLLLSGGPVLTEVTLLFAELLGVIVDVLDTLRSLAEWIPTNIIVSALFGDEEEGETEVDSRMQDLRQQTSELRRELFDLGRQAEIANTAGANITAERGGFALLMDIDRRMNIEEQQRDILSKIEANTREMAARQRDSAQAPGGWEVDERGNHFQTMSFGGTPIGRFNFGKTPPPHFPK